MGWFVFVERNGVFEGAFAKLFARPGDDLEPTCARCKDDRRNAPLLGIGMAFRMASGEAIDGRQRGRAVRSYDTGPAIGKFVATMTCSA